MKSDITVYILHNDDTLPSDLGYAIRSLKHENVVVKPWYNTGDITNGVLEVIADCDTEWLSFLDSDDICVEGIYEKLISQAIDGVDFVYCNEILHNIVTNKKDPGWSSADDTRGLLIKEPYLRCFWDYTNNRLAHHRGIFRTSRCKKFWPDYVTPDLFIQGQLIEHVQKGRTNNVVHISDVGYIWRIHNSNTTLKYLKGKESNNA